MRFENTESHMWVALGFAILGFTIPLAAYGSHGLNPKMQDQWATGVEYLRLAGIGIALMSLVRLSCNIVLQARWPERLVFIGCLMFSGMLLAECTPLGELSVMQSLGWIAPGGAILMTIGMLLFGFELFRKTAMKPSS
ncbi:MAG: DUF423 domain-containing protein [Bacteroidetes bacterium]|nr:DUF423 domain-containing protein [Bacteroidota bacterium]MDA1337037.1 DUF423 domain-containing protein [Bacteroidota bacterium]